MGVWGFRVLALGFGACNYVGYQVWIEGLGFGTWACRLRFGDPALALYYHYYYYYYYYYLQS